MSAPRSSIARLFLATLTVAVGLVALKNNSDFWLGVMVTTTAVWVPIALAGLFADRGHTRAFWCGFLLVGCGSLVMSFGPWSDAKLRSGGSLLQNYTQMQPTTKALVQLLYRFVRPR